MIVCSYKLKIIINKNMGRPKKWEDYKTLNIKVCVEKWTRYKQILTGKQKTIQQDIDDHINKVINE